MVLRLEKAQCDDIAPASSLPAQESAAWHWPLKINSGGGKLWNYRLKNLSGFR